MSVTQVQWCAENERFAVAFSDGLLSMCSKEQFEPPVSVEAHEVTQLFLLTVWCGYGW